MNTRLMISSLILVALIVATSDAQYNTRRGAGIGAVTGAVIGSVIGNQNDETAEGALLGGAIGAIAGGALGNQRDFDERLAWQYQQAQAAQQQYTFHRASSMNDIITMSQNGVSDQIIVNHIRQRGLQRELSVHDIVSLHRQGVSEYVLAAMQQNTGPAQIGVALPTPPVRTPTVVVHRDVYLAPPYIARQPRPCPRRPIW